MPWHTQWYATAAFGNLKPGTGLLLDMGRLVTVTSAQIMLGPITGAEFELRGRRARTGSPAAGRAPAQRAGGHARSR